MAQQQQKMWLPQQGSAPVAPISRPNQAMRRAGKAVQASFRMELDAMKQSRIKQTEDVAREAAWRAKADGLLAKLPLFIGMKEEQITRIVQQGDRVEFRAGDAIVAQHTNDEYSCMYLLVSGRADILIDEALIGTLRTGGSCGELALLHGLRHSSPYARKATVRATRRTVCLQITMGNFVKELAPSTTVCSRVQISSEEEDDDNDKSSERRKAVSVIGVLSAHDGQEPKNKVDMSMTNLRYAFDAIDTDGSGMIAKSELIDAMQIVGFPQKADSEADVMKLMRASDIDGHGQLDFREFTTLLGSFYRIVEEKVQRERLQKGFGDRR